MESTDWFGEDVAATYDEDAAGISQPAVLNPQLDVLEELAAGGPVLEFAIGAGRVGLPLAARGLRVAGIELSTAMVARLRAKPGGDEASIPVIIGDMATSQASGAGSFRLVFLVFNSLMNLTTQEAQVACFQNAAGHLAPGGHFVVELPVPALRRLPAGERFVVFDQSDTHVGIDEYDIATQRQWSHHIDFLTDGRVRRTSPPFRYSWPAELDLMARLAGMRLVHRWSDWGRTALRARARSTCRCGRSPKTIVRRTSRRHVESGCPPLLGRRLSTTERAADRHLGPGEGRHPVGRVLGIVRAEPAHGLVVSRLDLIRAEGAFAASSHSRTSCGWTDASAFRPSARSVEHRWQRVWRTVRWATSAFQMCPRRWHFQLAS